MLILHSDFTHVHKKHNFSYGRQPLFRQHFLLFLTAGFLVKLYSLWFADGEGTQRSQGVVCYKSCSTALRVDSSQLSSLQKAKICHWGFGMMCGWGRCCFWTPASHTGQGENYFTMWGGCGLHITLPNCLSHLVLMWHLRLRWRKGILISSK